MVLVYRPLIVLCLAVSLTAGTIVGCTEDKYAALIEAAGQGRIEKVKQLLAEGAEVNPRQKRGPTALIAAAWNGHFAIVNLLLDRGADVNAKLDNGTTALIAASLKGHTGVVKLLLQAVAKPHRHFFKVIMAQAN